MRKKFTHWLLISLVAMYSTSAFSLEQNKAYMGFLLGYSETRALIRPLVDFAFNPDGVAHLLDNLEIKGGTGAGKIGLKSAKHNGFFAGKLFFGYRAHRNCALELGYTYFKKAKWVALDFPRAAWVNCAKMKCKRSISFLKDSCLLARALNYLR